MGQRIFILENRNRRYPLERKRSRKTENTENFKISTATAVHPNKNTMYRNKSQKAVEAKEDETARQNVKVDTSNNENTSHTQPTKGIR